MPAATAMRHYFAPLFEPVSLAIIGASERLHAIGAVLAVKLLMLALLESLGFAIATAAEGPALRHAALALQGG